MRPPTIAALCGLLLTLAFAGPSRACTSFCFDAPEGPFFAANLDLHLGEGLVFVNPRGLAKEGSMTGTTGAKARWTSTYASITFNLVGREFAWSGINEAGLVLGTMQLRGAQFPAPDERPPLNMGVWAQYVLDTCGSIDDVLRTDSLVRVQDAEIPDHYLIADANGACVVIEFLHGRFVSFAGERLPVRALANATYASSLDFVEQGHVPTMNPGRSVERVAAAAASAQRYTANPDGPPVDFAFDVLTKTVVAPRGFWHDLFREPYTRWNVVYDIARREVHYRTVASPKVKHVALRSFDLSCASPVRMLDINAKLGGEVAHAFTPYDADVNLKVFRRFCRKYGVKVSSADAIALMRHFDTFECVGDDAAARPDPAGPGADRHEPR